ncbi:MAG TPA: DUF4252 domain-containing protein [Rhodothermales bacterium]|nr:DUF4252 domain-containing protein [Rhodothermales bacterium]
MARRLTLVPVLLASMLLSGCIYSREIAHTRREIERSYPEARLHRQVVLNFGPGSLGLISLLTHLVPGDGAREVAGYLQDVEHVKLGIYEVENMPALDDLHIARLDRLQRQGWEVAVKTREEDEAVWILYRERDDSVRDLYLFVLDRDDLVIARLRGDLRRLLQRAMAESDGDLTDLFRRGD